ncbi:KamA family radical SAM protein [Tepidibacillus infernus]|uniref:KamA family radical SAM protein n=1 Tax=Tepidibacillus TaxID=1494427 RepID=UPI0008589719|nr:KamA family radical SAM protein [Tepidibacillus sp. HK-1]GBF11095.1 L-lysine 2,3-aminomutase [Tepidibacillus sp. HK-1]
MIFHIDKADVMVEIEKIEEVIDLIKKENPGFCEIIMKSKDDDELREKIYQYFYHFEIHCLQSCHMNALQRYQSQQALRVLKNLFSPRHEAITHFSVLKNLKKCLNQDYHEVGLGFAYEILFLFRALKGTTGLEQLQEEKPMSKMPEWSLLDHLSKEVNDWMSRYPSGLDNSIILQRIENRESIKSSYKITNKEWDHWKWQCQNVIRDRKELEKFISLTEEEKEAIDLANHHQLPFGITPFFLSLLDLNDPESKYDHAIRAQAFPPLRYIQRLVEVKKHHMNMSLSQTRQIPTEISITRGYPMIAIFKPIRQKVRYCLYCERSWAINHALWRQDQVELDKIDRAIRWFNRHPGVTEVLISGDIMIYDDPMIEEILSRLADISHIQRIRVSTRIPMILPMRITDSLVHLLSSYQISGRREISLMTHFEHPYEVTLEAMKAIQKLRKTGVQVCNQSIYTVENARRFEMSALRKQLRLIGVDPYYSFNAKKDIPEERVPIARMIQEQNEESRLAPGIDRSDEAVFDIPGMGKNYLKASQEHELIMILGDGSRVYEFYPSDVNLFNKRSFLYRDVPIFTFLQQLAHKGENLKDYQSIWYYY